MLPTAKTFTRALVVAAAVAAALTVCSGQASAWTWPSSGAVLRPFRLGNDPYIGGQHRGIDVGGASGAAVLAPASGVVSFAGPTPDNGLTVTIRTDLYSVTLVHLGSISVSRDAVLAEGAAVGTIGPSGTPEGPEPYVHLGIRVASDADGYV